ncbi:Outward-rectifier potassium channel TOK1 like protein [Verticillium longisporum]|nr:Outward-rectifier potassium channel TOK1 like protein [Verticillium longisporum]
MNDPDLDARIEDHVNEYQGEKSQSQDYSNDQSQEKQDEVRFENDGFHMTPSRWWFASSAFPMIAGTLGPVASAFSICALVRSWRQHRPPGTSISDAKFVADPEWLLIINAIQLAIAITSNLFLLLNMARRVRFSIAQPITIIGWYIAAFTLIALLATAAGPLQLQPSHEYIWSQAFFYGLNAAVLYFVTASLMVVTFYGAHTRRYPRDFQLTASQRTLMLQTIAYLFYLLIGALVFAKLEGWIYLDAVYWANTTLFTIGYGDYSPSSTLARALLIPYALIGIVTLGLLIDSILSMVLERGRRRLDARMVEKRRRTLIRKMTKRGADVLVPIDNANSLVRPSTGHSSGSDSEYNRRKHEFSLMRRIQHEATTRRRWMALIISLSAWLALWLLGALVFHACEKPYQPWDYFDAFYFSFISLTTIGYGDLSLVSNAGRVFHVAWTLLALPTTTVMISNAGDTVVLARGFKEDLAAVVHRFSLGIVSSDKAPADHDAEDETHAFPKEFAHAVRRNTSSLAAMDGSDGDDAAAASEYHFHLIQAISTVSTALTEPSQRRYTFAEWATFLQLLGEDEADASTHCRAKPHEHKRRKRRPVRVGTGEAKAPGPDLDSGDMWSWVGSRSPLMGSQEESEWLLKKLTQKLQDELKRARVTAPASPEWDEVV